MASRLNGWQRIGIVLSIAWAIGGGLWGSYLGVIETRRTIAISNLCYHEIDRALSNMSADDLLAQLDAGENGTPDQLSDQERCVRGFEAWSFAADLDFHWYVAALVAIAPIALAWLVIYGVVGVARWIIRGFQEARRA